MNNIEVDARQVTSMFADLTSRQQRQVYRSALRKGAGILATETKRQLRQALGRAASSRNWWNGRTLAAGVKSNADRNGEEAKVHIMGDFRLKFFEMGTRVRRTTGSNTASVRGRNPIRRQRAAANRGNINAAHFFRTAKANKEREIFDNMDNLISQSIQRIANRFDFHLCRKCFLKCSFWTFYSHYIVFFNLNSNSCWDCDWMSSDT